MFTREAPKGFAFALALVGLWALLIVPVLVWSVKTGEEPPALTFIFTWWATFAVGLAWQWVRLRRVYTGHVWLFACVTFVSIAGLVVEFRS